MEFDRQRNADRDELSGAMGSEQDGHVVASRRSFLRRSVMGAAVAAPLGVMVVNQAVSAHNVQAAHAVVAPQRQSHSWLCQAGRMQPTRFAKYRLMRKRIAHFW
jgi:hypothetical protein